MKTTRTWSLTLVLGLISALVVGVTGAASGQTPQGQMTAVNGSFADPVAVTADSIELAGELGFGDTSDSVVVPASDAGYTVVFTAADGSAQTVIPVAASTAWTVVSGYGEEDEGAASYPVDVAPIADGKAKLAVWNATTADVSVSVNDAASDLAPGEGVAPQETDPGEVTVAVGDVSQTITLAADQYVDVFVVSDGTNTALAGVLIPSMTELIETLGGTTPDPGITVPDVAGLSAEDATSTLVDAGFSAVGEVDEASDTVEAGLAIRTDPAAGETIPADTTIDLYVSTGPSTVAVPDVVGQTQDDAVAALEDAGFTTSVEEQASDDVEEGLVISTNPNGGTEVAPGTEVTVVVSTGPEDVEVPDVAGLTADEATSVLEAVGLTITVVDDPDDPDPDGVVIYQDPAAGEIVPSGTDVTVEMSPLLQDPWTSIKLDPDRILTAGGINFEPGSTSRVEVLTTTLAAEDVVAENGHWLVQIDTNTLDPSTAYAVLVTGTAEDGSEYEQTFTLPPPGETVDEPQEPESSGLPGWAWLAIIILVVAVIVVGAMLLKSRESTPDDGGDGASSGDQDATPPGDGG